MPAELHQPLSCISRESERAGRTDNSIDYPRLLHELLSQNTFSALYDIRRQLDEVRQEARASGDLKTCAQLTNSSLKSVEVLIGLTERFKSRQEQALAIGTQNNLLVINMMEKDGSIKVIDIEKVKKLLGDGEAAP